MPARASWRQGVVQRMQRDELPTDKAAVKRVFERNQVKTWPQMHALLKAKVFWSSRRRAMGLASIGLAGIAYIVENPDDSGGGVFEYDRDGASSREEVLAEAEAILETLQANVRVADGGGLYHKTSEKQWARHRPDLPPDLAEAVHEKHAALPIWTSPTDRPGSGDATPTYVTTPGGTQLYHSTTYVYSSPGGTENRLATFAAGIGERVERHDFGGSTSEIPKLKKVMVEQKRTGSVKVNKARLDGWAGQRANWRPDQNGAMGGVSAGEAAAASGITGGEWQWLHLIAFTLGGIDNVQPNHADNLVVGHAAANGHHLVLENCVKKLILSGITDEVEISAVAFMAIGSFQVARKIKYLLQWTPKEGRPQYTDWEIDCLDPNKSVGGHLKIVFEMLRSFKGI
jgi:hypothetical protein